MNSKAGCSLIRAVRQVHICGLAPGSRIPRITSRTYASGFKRQLNSIQNVYTRTSPFTNPNYRPGLSIRFLYRETPDSTIEGDTEQVKKLKDGLDVQLQILEAVSLDSANPSDHVRPQRRTFTERRDFTDPLDDGDIVDEAWEHGGRKDEMLSRELIDALQKCTSPSDVLELTTQYALSWKQNSSCLTAMWESVKKMSEEKRHYERKLMFEHPAFTRLCLCVMQEVGRMTREDLVYSLHALLKLKVSQRTRVVETLFRHCQERLNEFDEKALSVLASSLEGLESTINVEALRAGLRLRVEQQIPQIKGTLALQTMMRCIGKDAPLSLKKKLESKALQLFHKFSLPNCQHMFITLASMNFCSIPLLDACSNRIIGNIDGIPFWRFVHILQSCRDLQYRNVTLFSAVGDYMAGTMYMWQNKQVVIFLSLFENLGFRHVGLMDLFAETVTSNPQSLNLKDLVITLRVYSLLNHIPGDHNPQFLEALNSTLEIYLPRIPAVELLRSVYSCCILGYFPQAPIDRLLQENILKELLNSANQNVYVNERMLHYINVCLELEKPQVPKPPATVVLGRSSAPVQAHTDMMMALHSLLGEQGFFRQHVQLPNDYYIDFEVCMDKDRRKVIPETGNGAENNTADVQRVAVLCAPMSAFCLGTDHPKGKLAMKWRHLRAMGYHVVLVHEQEFEKMKTEDRVGFLRSQIFTEDAVHIPDSKPTEQQLET